VSGLRCSRGKALQETQYRTVDFSLPGVEKKLPF
jgi:hypothetical protein